MKEGYIISWRSNGKKKKEGEYEKGKKCGLWVYYYRSGCVMKRGNYHKGLMDGTWTEYYDNSEQILRLSKWENGIEMGHWTEWFPGGEIRLETEYSEGKIVCDVLFYQTGKVARAESKDIVKKYYGNGEDKVKYLKRDGKKHGQYQSWYPSVNGAAKQIKKLGSYQEGSKIGIWSKWDVTGELISVTKYHVVNIN